MEAEQPKDMSSLPGGRLPGGRVLGNVPIRPGVFILSAFRLLREGIASALSREPTIQVVGAADLSMSPMEIAGFRPDAILLDIYVPDAFGVVLHLRKEIPETKIIALGVNEVEQTVIACAKAGIAGFVYLQGSANDIVTAVHSGLRGELVCSPRTAGMLLSRVSSLGAGIRSGCFRDMLTAREQETLVLMSEGLSNKQIARQLRIQDATVKHHVHSILSKLGVHRRGEAVAQLRQNSRIDDNAVFANLQPNNDLDRRTHPSELDHSA